ncbi:hypothetical protein BKA64DRAFT_644937 [Cadophora sp. MPI-SDFR-AT-0126]|nr:hypothetical protein BKA64DRAFT_644937 [Leotiomycetes sp. MPI-SDFR-AT-0126]
MDFHQPYTSQALETLAMTNRAHEVTQDPEEVEESPTSQSAELPLPTKSSQSTEVDGSRPVSEQSPNNQPTTLPNMKKPKEHIIVTVLNSLTDERLASVRYGTDSISLNELRELLEHCPHLESMEVDLPIFPYKDIEGLPDGLNFENWRKPAGEKPGEVEAKFHWCVRRTFNAELDDEGKFKMWVTSGSERVEIHHPRRLRRSGPRRRRSGWLIGRNTEMGLKYMEDRNSGLE